MVYHQFTHVIRIYHHNNYPTQELFGPRRLLKPARTLSSTAKNPRKSMWPVSSTETCVSGTPMALAKALVVISWQAPKEKSKISTSANKTINIHKSWNFTISKMRETYGFMMIYDDLWWFMKLNHLKEKIIDLGKSHRLKAFRSILQYFEDMEHPQGNHWFSAFGIV